MKVLLLTGLALVWLATAQADETKPVTAAVGKDFKGNLSTAAYVVAIVVCFFLAQWAAQAIYALVALIWLVPDRRIERILPPAA